MGYSTETGIRGVERIDRLAQGLSSFKSFPSSLLIGTHSKTKIAITYRKQRLEQSSNRYTFRAIDFLKLPRFLVSPEPSARFFYPIPVVQS